MPADAEPNDEFINDGKPVWDLRVVDDDALDPVWALYTRFDLTVADEAAVAAGDLVLQPLFDERVARILPIIERIQDETDRFFEDLLLGQIAEAVEVRRIELGNREAVSRTFSFPNMWTLPPLRLEEPSAPPAPTATSGISLQVPYTARLESASFGRLQRTIRVWADAIERYPAAYKSLGEERISDLLCATLHATLPSADREVFSRSGKTDILVRANVLANGAEPATVFIAENKWATSKKVIHEALDPQLFSYLNATDTAAVLLVLLGQRHHQRAKAAYLDVLRKVPGFQSESDSMVAGWPLFTFKVAGRRLDVCIATIHVPRS